MRGVEFELLSCIVFVAVMLSTGGTCDIYDAAGTPCVAAHSMVRALYASYSGPLYAVKRAVDNATIEVPLLVPGGFADSSVQDAFCSNSACVVQRIFDQSPRGNHLDVGPAGGAPFSAHHPDEGVNASKDVLWVGAHRAYGAYFESKKGYRNNNATGLAVGDQPESMYMVVNGRHYNRYCCFDYGNAEVDSHDDGAGTMEAVYFGQSNWPWGHGGGNGPWVMADLENGLFPGKDRVNLGNPSIDARFVTAMLKGKAGTFSLKGADAQSGRLQTLYDGERPEHQQFPPIGGNYTPMKKQGAIILGTGGDNSNWAQGTFYEGAITYGYADEATDQAVQVNIVAAGYGRGPDVFV